jgi:hypothetical protein
VVEAGIMGVLGDRVLEMGERQWALGCEKISGKSFERINQEMVKQTAEVSCHAV